MKYGQIEDFINATINSLKSVLKSETVIGAPIYTADKSTIIPICKVSFGFVSGGSEITENSLKNIKTELPVAGGSGAGVSIKPLGFLVNSFGSFSFISLEKAENEGKWSEILSMAVKKVFKNND